MKLRPYKLNLSYATLGLCIAAGKSHVNDGQPPSHAPRCLLDTLPCVKLAASWPCIHTLLGEGRDGEGDGCGFD